MRLIYGIVEKRLDITQIHGSIGLFTIIITLFINFVLIPIVVNLRLLVVRLEKKLR